MTPQISQAVGKHIESELDRLTYSAYLLILDPGVAVSVVMTAIDGSFEEITTGPDLLERTVELALEQLRRESRTEGDGESSAFDAVLYAHSAAINSPTFQSLKDLSGNPILLLDSTSRIAFVLHHVLGYKLGEAAAKAQMDETECRAPRRQIMSWLSWILAYLFDCVHPHTTWPRRHRAGFAYVACLDCGRELPYSLDRMRIVTRVELLADRERDDAWQRTWHHERCAR